MRPSSLGYRKEEKDRADDEMHHRVLSPIERHAQKVSPANLGQGEKGRTDDDDRRGVPDDLLRKEAQAAVYGIYCLIHLGSPGYWGEVPDPAASQRVFTNSISTAIASGHI